jgi:hypothetical protein
MDTKKGWILIKDDDGSIKLFEQEFPIETHSAALSWGMDMLRAIHQHGKFRKWLMKLTMGKYAVREMIGLDDAINKYGFDTHYDYDLKQMEYHHDKVKF